MEENKDVNSYQDDYVSLKSWPHTLTAIEDTLDKDLIEGRARQLLYRALSTNTLVAFVGSGVSAAYGRMSWSQLKETQIDEVTNVADKFGKLAEKSLLLIKVLLTYSIRDKIPPPGTGGEFILVNHLHIKYDEIDYQRREIDNLQSTFDSLRLSDNALGGDIYPIQIQIAKRLMDALQRAEALFVKRLPTLDRRRGKPFILSDAEKHRKLCKYGYLADDGDKYLLDRNLKSVLAEIQYDQLPAYVEFKSAFRSYFRAICNRGANLRFKDHTKYLLYDECAHAEHTVFTGTSYSARAGRKRWRLAHKEKVGKKTRADIWGVIEKEFPDLDPARLSRGIKGISNAPHNYSVLGFFKKEPVNRLCSLLLEGDEFRNDSAAWRNIVNLIKLTSTSGQTPANVRTIWSPTRRYIVSMLLSRLKDPLGNANFIKLFHSKVDRTDFRARYSLIHEDMDPLVHLSLDLSIKHFLTTNYDLEIERLFADRGYNVVKSFGGNVTDEQRGRDDLLGGRSIDSTFERDRTADLVSFSLNLENADNSVFHLHGRATHDSEIVLTERDYMDLYLRNDEYRDSIDESIDLAFSANPVLFVGLGMNEDDVLRPMRQFVSDQERRWDRTAIALMPATRSLFYRRTEASTLYTRYGALAVYYGDATVDDVKCEWLAIINTLCKALTFYNQKIYQSLVALRRYSDLQYDRTELIRQANEDPFTFQEELTDHLEFVYQHLIEFNKNCPKELANRRNEWLRQHYPRLLEAVNGHEPSRRRYHKDVYQFIAEFPFSEFLPQIEPQASGHSSSHKPDIHFELGLIGNLRDVIFNLRLDSNALTNGPSGLTPTEQLDFLKKLDIDAVNTLIRDCRAVGIGLDGSMASIHTATLSSFLRLLKHDQKKWLDDWQFSPKNSTATVRN